MRRVNFTFILTIILVGLYSLKFNFIILEREYHIPTENKKVDSSKRATIIAVGDIMFHSPQVKNAFNGHNYDFRTDFNNIRGEIRSADVALANFEAVIDTHLPLSGFPKFNVPEETLEGIKYAGFNVLNIANNHIMDCGQEGILQTERSIKKMNLYCIGAGTPEERKYAIINCNGIRIAILSYTEMTNAGIAAENMVNYMKLDIISNDIKAVKPYSDYIIVYLHSGTEYVREVEEKQRLLYKKIALMGADCILNSHPHVARETELYKINGRKVLVNYSLGNFLSNQNDKYTDIGLMVKIYLTKKANVTHFDGDDIIPVYRLRYTESGKINYKIVECDKINNYKDKVDQREMSYIKEVDNAFSSPSTVTVEAFNGNLWR